MLPHTHTSTRPRAYVLVTGSGSNGEFNCLGKKINKQHYAASLTSSYKGGLSVTSGGQKLDDSQPVCRRFTVKQKLLSESAPSRSPVIFKAAPFPGRRARTVLFRQNGDFHRRPRQTQPRRRGRLAGAPFHDSRQRLCEVGLLPRLLTICQNSL